jgi:hypothetical protein
MSVHSKLKHEVRRYAGSHTMIVSKILIRSGTDVVLATGIASVARAKSR